MKVIGYISLFILMAVIHILYSGYALSILWGWFIEPTFGVDQLSMTSAIGLSMVVAFLTHQVNPSQFETESEFVEILGRVVGLAIVRPTVALAMGWIVTLWM
jgi:hydrogenase/urease accessory protein HupE